MESVTFSKEFKEVREQVRECMQTFVATFQGLFRHALIHSAQRANEKHLRKQEKRQKRLGRQIPRRARARHIDMSPTSNGSSQTVSTPVLSAPAFTARITEWHEIHTYDHYGVRRSWKKILERFFVYFSIFGLCMRYFSLCVSNLLSVNEIKQ
jgi:hypothetical protein